MTSVSVVIPTRNNRDELVGCITSLLRQARPPTRLLVCIDGSMDGTAARLAAMPQTAGVSIHVLEHEGNAHKGRATTRNLALPHIDNGFVWFVDSDMIVAPDALSRHLELVEGGAAASVGAVEYTNADDAMWAGYLNTRGRHRREHGEELPFTQFTTANSLVRADDVLALGGFDERFDGYGGEDLEFAFRLQEHAGGPFINNKQAVASTIETKAMEAALMQFESYGATNIHLMEQLHPTMPRTFELQRMNSRSARDRVFAASMNPVTDRLADAGIRFGTRRLRHHAINYKVIRAVWRGYIAGSARV